VKLLVQCTDAVEVVTLYIMRYVSIVLEFTDYEGIFLHQIQTWLYKPSVEKLQMFIKICFMTSCFSNMT
jgi:hypothetical protein